MTSGLDITSDPLQDDIPVIRLLPSPIPPGGQAKWSSSGRTLLAALSPSSNSFTAWVAPKVDLTAKAWEDENGILREEPVTRITDIYEPDKAIYMGAWGSADESLHAFYKDTFTIFNSAQAIHQVQVAPLMSGNLPQTDGSSSSPTYEQDQEIKRVGYMRELAENYMEAVEEVVRDTQLDASIRAHHLSILCILSLATLLFFPQDGLGDSLVGEELLDWLNSYGDGDGWGSICDSANRLASRVKEWEEDDWENTVCLSILRGPEVAQRLLQSLSDSHPEPQIASFANILSSSLAKVPRSRDVDKHPTSASFLSAHASWRERLRAEISIFCHGREDQGGWLELENDVDGIDRAVLEEESERWEQVLMRFASLMLGDQGAILETTEAEGGGDWTLALGIWGVWVDVSLRRDRYTDEGWVEGGMRPALATIAEALPVDPNNLQETIMLALCNNEITDALVQCNKMSLWLATHVTDLLEKLNLVDDDDDETYELPLRDYFVFQYTDMLLLAHEGYWEVACDYLSGCGAQGVGRIREILKRISLNIENPPNSTQADNNEDTMMEVTSTIIAPGGTADSNDDFETVNALLKVASDHGLEDERREICRLAALRLLQLRRYGQAVAYCIHSMDTRLLAVIGEAVLDVYCSDGTEAYLQAVETIPSSVFVNDDGGHHVLFFLARFKEFLDALADDRRSDAAKIVLACFGEGLVPMGFNAVLLLDTTQLLEDSEVLLDENDTCELLRNLENVLRGATLSPSTYLTSLANLLRRKMDFGKANTLILKHNVVSPTGRYDHRSTEWNAPLEALDAVRLASARNLSRIDMY